MIHRVQFYEKLKGEGLEVGALHEPARVPSDCKVYYFDVRDREASAKLFREIDASKIVEVDFIGDVDKGDLSKLGEERFDFVIANHVIEHLANPILFVKQMFALVRPGGFVIISAPDMKYTFDSARELTSYEHLWNDYKERCDEASDDHYLEFIEKVLPEGKGISDAELEKLLSLVRKRREHVHVWNSRGFADFMKRSIADLGISAKLIYADDSQNNKIEYFGVWRKRRNFLIQGFRILLYHKRSS